MTSQLTLLLIILRDGFQKKSANYPHFVDKGGRGSQNVDKRGGGGRRMWIKKFLNVNIINFENVDKPEGGGSDNVDKVILLNFGTF